MRLEISDYCIRCGLCEDMFPDLFKRNFDEHSFEALYSVIPEELEERAKAAVAECAVAAITGRN